MNLCGIFLYIYYFIFITHRYVEPTSSMNHFQHFNSRLRNSILRLFVFNEYYKEMKFKSMKHLLQMKENVHKKINNIESKYYDISIHYYSLSEEEMSLLENIVSLFY